MSKIIVTIIGAILIAFVAWFFFGKKSDDMSKMSEEDMAAEEHMNM